MAKSAGLVPFTTIDFPNRLAAVIFFQGCPLRCPFCHNPNLQPYESVGEAMAFEEIMAFLSQRRKRLDGVVLSGGEPLMQSDIVSVARTLKEMGFQVAVHTSGAYPDRLKELLPLLDWVGFDMKAPWQKYPLLCGREGLTAAIEKSLDLLIESGVDYEVRTTLDPRYLTIDDVFEIADILQNKNVQTYTLQKYRTFDADKNPPSSVEINAFFENEALMRTLQNIFPHFACR